MTTPYFHARLAAVKVVLMFWLSDVAIGVELWGPNPVWFTGFKSF